MFPLHHGEILREGHCWVGEEPMLFFCPYCTVGHNEPTGTFQKKELIGKLVGQCFNGNAHWHDQLFKFVKTVRKDFFDPGAVPEKVVGPIHALCLQLDAK